MDWNCLDVLLFLEGKAKKAMLKLDIATLNANDGMAKLYEKLNTFSWKMLDSLYGIQVF